MVQAERTASYAEIATSSNVLNEAASDPDVTQSAGPARFQVSAIDPENSVLINITARDDDPEQASVIANAVATQAAKRIERLEKPVGRRVSDSPIRVSLAQPARPPSSPTSPKVARNIVIAILGGILLGLIAAILREMFDRRFRDPAQIRDQFDLPVLTGVDFDRGLKDHSMLVSHADINEETISQDRAGESLAAIPGHGGIPSASRRPAVLRFQRPSAPSW